MQRLSRCQDYYYIPNGKLNFRASKCNRQRKISGGQVWDSFFIMMTAKRIEKDAFHVLTQFLK